MEDLEGLAAGLAGAGALRLLVHVSGVDRDRAATLALAGVLARAALVAGFAAARAFAAVGAFAGVLLDGGAAALAGAAVLGVRPLGRTVVHALADVLAVLGLGELLLVLLRLRQHL